MPRARRIPPHVMFVIIAAVVSAYAISNILSNRAERDQLDACRDGVVAAAELREPERKAAVARACAPLIARRPCRDAFATFAAADTPARLGALVRSCRDAYCAHLEPAPAVCAVTVPSPDDAGELFAKIFRDEHGGSEEAALLGRTLAAALGALRD